MDLLSKKTLRASEQERGDIIQARTEWAEFQKTVDPNRLIFLDESGVKTNMTRLYGRIIDNLSAHKSQDAYDAIKGMHAECLFLPAYSPDLNPIEKMWSKVKQILRGIKARTHEDLLAGVEKALDRVSANDAQSWFKPCRYTQFKS